MENLTYQQWIAVAALASLVAVIGVVLIFILSAVKNRIKFLYKLTKKLMEKLIKTELTQGMTFFEKKIMEIDSDKKAIQIKILTDIAKRLPGNEAMVKKIKANGVPKIIFVSSHVAPEIRLELEFFAPVQVCAWFAEYSIILSWEGNILSENNFNQKK